MTGIIIGTVTQTQKVWRSFQALGDIAFAYSYSIILIEIQVRILEKIDVLFLFLFLFSSFFNLIDGGMLCFVEQDTLKSPPSEAKTMKKATLVSVSVTTLF